MTRTILGNPLKAWWWDKCGDHFISLAYQLQQHMLEDNEFFIKRKVKFILQLSLIPTYSTPALQIIALMEEIRSLNEVTMHFKLTYNCKCFINQEDIFFGESRVSCSQSLTLKWICLYSTGNRFNEGPEEWTRWFGGKKFGFTRFWQNIYANWNGANYSFLSSKLVEILVSR